MNQVNIVALMLATSVLIVTFLMPLALAQKIIRVEVRPAEFTAHDVPPGMFAILEGKLIIKHYDNISRFFSISVEVPPENEVREGYSPIPDPTWVFLMVGGSTTVENATIVVGENSWGEVGVALNIPPWENLTSQRWEAWIHVKLEAEPGEIVAPLPIIRMKVETAKEVYRGPRRRYVAAMVAAIVVAAIAVALAILIRRRRKGEVRRRVFE